MADLEVGESTEMKGSGVKPYVLKNVGGLITFRYQELEGLARRKLSPMQKRLRIGREINAGFDKLMEATAPRRLGRLEDARSQLLPFLGFRRICGVEERPSPPATHPRDGG